MFEMNPKTNRDITDCGIDLSGFDAVLSFLREGEIALEYARPRYLLVTWKVIEDPMTVPKCSTRKNKKGYYNYRGWVGCSGRLMPYIWDVQDYRIVRKYEDQYCDLNDKVLNGEYVRLFSDVFMFDDWIADGVNMHGRKPPVTGGARYLEVFIPKPAWVRLTPKEQWDYVRDVSYWGKDYDYTRHKSMRASIIEQYCRKYELDLRDHPFIKELLDGKVVFYENALHDMEHSNYGELLYRLSKFDTTSPGHLTW